LPKSMQYQAKTHLDNAMAPTPVLLETTATT